MKQCIDIKSLLRCEPITFTSSKWLGELSSIIETTVRFHCHRQNTPMSTYSVVQSLVCQYLWGTVSKHQVWGTCSHRWM